MVAAGACGGNVSTPSMGHFVSDEGTISWPAGVAGSNGSTTMYVAEINLVNSCVMPNPWW